MKNIKYILGILAIAFTLQSCESLLDQENPNNVSEEQGVSTLIGTEKIVRSFYSNLPTNLEMYNQALITDEVVYPAATNANQGGGRGQYSWEFGPGTTTDRDDIAGLYRGYYYVITNTNIVITNIDKLTPQTDLDKSLQQLYKAEAYGMRAYSHYMLVRNFSPKYNPSAMGVVYKETTDQYEKGARLSMQETYTKILADLDYAISIFPVTIPATHGGTYKNNRLTKQALYGIKSKIALDLGNYDDVISLVNQSIGTRTLVSSQADLVSLWNDSNDFQEVIFKRSNIDGAGSAPGGLWYYANTGQTQWNASQTLMTKYSTTDFRRSLFLTSGGAQLPGKYLLPWQQKIKASAGVADAKLIRTADLILIKAEAYARKGDLTNALIEYAKVRTARNAGTSPAFASQTDALDKILDERARELVYEGSRLNDLKRFDKTVVRIAADSRPTYPTLIMNNKLKLTLPIPQKEMFANPNMKQNEGW
ncbi:RagB/SusD family nutrient uptake outer membrane protein [Empedobacter falsenii]|uniref:RagB/SusD family nutrient uptake outer membrane protein n=1 Tax=Empedobacter falsenii TaxID=343874 RepID=UPI00257810BF|nr:RagB/SusD family nutrient uptake outer membrane protein [Empedobacter falsenii]MDM1062706.1 RagB/SusD family nutrient uptake outer membrane protein [Empedobacter falsenii]MDM1548087.1 RagB/SusD family nutrient uptake outer membrane protein [Empedobacter falsenii]